MVALFVVQNGFSFNALKAINCDQKIDNQDNYFEVRELDKMKIKYNRTEKHESVVNEFLNIILKLQSGSSETRAFSSSIFTKSNLE